MSRFASFVLGNGPARRVWPLTLVLIAAGLAITLFHVVDLRQPDVGFTLPWWAFALVVAVIEFPLIHLYMRSEAHSVTLGELALCLGLFLVPPAILMFGAVIGAVIAKSRQVPVKLAFNTGLSFLQAAVAVTLFHAIADLGDPFGARSIVAAFIAMTVIGTLGILAVSVAIALAQGRSRLRPLATAAAIAGPVNIANTGLGLIASFLVTQAPQMGLALVGPIAVVFITYRAFVVEHQQHRRLKVVYQTTRTILETPEISGATDAVLRLAREVFRAEITQIVLYADRPDGGMVVTTTGVDGMPGEALVIPTLDGTIFADALFANRAAMLDVLEVGRRGGLIGTDSTSVRDAIVAPLRGERRVVGAIAVANRLGTAGGFDESDLVLLETLAGHAGVAIENGQLQAELAMRATHDALTGLANRMHFESSLAAALAEGEKDEEAGAVGVVYIDIDDFKAVNDGYGHSAGDWMLQEIADRLKACLRTSDLAGRLGGDEFAVLFLGVSGVDELSRLVERLQASIERPIPLGYGFLEPRVSLGVTLTSGQADAEAVLADGDAAMYYAKRAGKGRSAVFDVEMRNGLTTRTELANALAQAAGAGELVLHYQPVVSIRDRGVVAVEALVRWYRPGWGVLPPSEFIPLAEEVGLASSIGQWVIREACGQVARWNIGGIGSRPLRLMVNVSPEQLADDDFETRVQEAVHASGLDPALLTLEVTERALACGSEEARDRLHRLRAGGIRVAVDDFGAGESSLAKLVDYPVDALKIPGEFVTGGADQSRSGLAEAMVTLGRTLGLVTIAETIESAGQLERFEHVGCDFAQGNLFAPAMPAAELALWLLSDRPDPVVGAAR